MPALQCRVVPGELKDEDLVAVELRHEYEEMAMVIKQSYNKCVPEIMGGNLDYLLCLAQMDKQEPLPPV